MQKDTKESIHEYIQTILWDEDFKEFFNLAAGCSAENVFDLFICKYFDHDQLKNGYDQRLLNFCSDQHLGIAKYISDKGGYDFLYSDDGNKLIYEYYSQWKDSTNAAKLWLLGFVIEHYSRYVDELRESIHFEGVFGPRWSVLSFVYYRKSADLGFSLGFWYVLYCLYSPDSYGIAIKNRMELYLSYYNRAIKLGLPVSEVFN